MPLDPQKIRRRRQNLKLTVTAAAARAMMAQPHWSRLEAGGRNDPILSTALQIAAALDCSLEKLLR